MLPAAAAAVVLLESCCCHHHHRSPTTMRVVDYATSTVVIALAMVAVMGIILAITLVVD